MKTKLTDNDPRLTSYALGELPREEADEIARILDAPLNGPLKRQVEGIDELGVMLTQNLEVGKSEDLHFKLSPSQRDAIFRSAKAPTVNDVSSSNQSTWLRPMLVTLGAAAVVTISFMVLNNVDSGQKQKPVMAEVSFSNLSDEILSAPIQPSNAEWGGATVVSGQGVQGSGLNHDLGSHGVSIGDAPEKLLELVENGWVNRADKAINRMPLASGKASWNWVKNSISVNGVLPNKNAVRVEEILNAFNYDAPSDLEQTFTTSGVELVQCPWNTDRMIAVILVKNKHTDSAQVEAAVTFGESVERYRLIGYAKAESMEKNIIAPTTITMGVGDSHLVMYEIDTTADIEDAADVLSLNIHTSSMLEDDEEMINDDQTLKVQFSDRAWTKAGRDVQFALILASWSQIISERNHDAAMDKAGVLEMINHFETAHSLTDKQIEAMMLIKTSLTLVSSTAKGE